MSLWICSDSMKLPTSLKARKSRIQLLRQAADTLELEITDEMLQKGVDEQMNVLQAQLSKQGLTLDMYCQFMKTTPEAMREDMKPQAEMAIRCRAAIDEIVKR